MRKLAVGLAMIGLVVVIAASLDAFFFGVLLCSDVPPVLKNLGVDFAPWNPATGRAGAFIFAKGLHTPQSKIFLEFGAVVEGPEGTKKVLPTFEYYVDRDANVYAATGGVVKYVEFQKDTQDWAIGISPRPGSCWVVEHDHILNPTVSKGDIVSPGQVLGKPGNWYWPDPMIGRTEIMVIKRSHGNDVAYAPFKFFDESLSQEYQQKVWRLMSDWENFVGDQTVYNQEAMIYAGCLYESLPC
jgi:hypothetical protein